MNDIEQLEKSYNNRISFAEESLKYINVCVKDNKGKLILYSKVIIEVAKTEKRYIKYHCYNNSYWSSA